MSQLRFLYRKARSEDVCDIKLIETACGLSPWSIKDYLEEVEKNPNFIVCELEQKPVGFLLARLITQNDWLNQDEKSDNLTLNKESFAEAEILNIGILEKYRRNKIGLKLVESVLNKLKKYDKYSICLDVRISNSFAIEFYKNLNFIIISRRKNLYTNPPEDGYLMKLEKN